MTGYELAKRLYATNDPDWTQFGSIERLSQIQRAIRLIHLVLVERRSHLARTSAVLTATAGQGYVDLPTDFMALHDPRKGARIPALGQDLRLVPPEDLDTIEMEALGLPEVCCPEGTRLLLGPVPMAAYQLKLRYYNTAPELPAGGENPATETGATAILQANQIPWNGVFAEAMVPVVESWLLQREEYDTRDLVGEMQTALEPTLSVIDRNRHERWKAESGQLWEDLGL